MLKSFGILVVVVSLVLGAASWFDVGVRLRQLALRLSLQLVVFVVVLEGMLRLGLAVTERVITAPSVPELNEEHRLSNPNFHFYDEGMDGDSLAIGERTPTRVGDELRVVAFGDSFSRGSGADYAQSLLPRLAHELRAGLGSRHLQLFNLGEAAMNFWEMECRYWDVGRHLSPDMVLWIYVLNDLERPGSLYNERNDLINDMHTREHVGTGLLLWDLPQQLLAQQVITEQTIRSYQEAYDPELNQAELAVFEEGMGRIIDDTTARGGRFVFVLFPLLYELDEYPFRDAHRVLGDIVTRQGGEVIDLLPAYEGLEASTLWATPDDYHPNDYGHWLASRHVINNWKSELPAAGTIDCERLDDIEWGDAHKRRPVHQQLTQARKAVCEAPEDPTRKLDLAELQVGILERQFAANGRNERTSECIQYRQFKLNALAGVAMGQSGEVGRRESIEERAKSLLDRHRTATGDPY